MTTVLDQSIGENYALFNGDCVEVVRGLPDASVDYSIFSPPFASLYTYSNSPRDMGNVRNDDEFFEQFDYLVQELRRVVKPGHNVSFHCMLMPTSKVNPINPHARGRGTSPGRFAGFLCPQFGHVFAFFDTV